MNTYLSVSCIHIYPRCTHKRTSECAPDKTDAMGISEANGGPKKEEETEKKKE